MCGIAGFVNNDPVDVKCRIIQKMTDIIAHRGPDDSGKHVDEYAALGHRRLSIIDLEGSAQPIYNENRELSITFNGEIYNYQELRKALVAAGHTFSTQGDTEVLLHGYEEWGKGLLQRLRGMFAFVIWNSRTHELFAARDHFGIKPFYYAQMNGTFMYASEIKSLLQHPDFVKELNKDSLLSYMTFQYSALPETFFKGVYRLPEGHWLTYQADTKKLTIEQWYDENFSESNTALPELVEHIDQTVCDSVKAHQIADVEVGSFLSSGVDSSYVAAVARPEHTYSIGFGKGMYNESQQAHELAELIGLNNTTEELSGREAFSAFPVIQWHLDEPDANPSCVPLYFLSRLAAKDLRVVLSGEGADELFGGYIDYGVHTKSKVIKVITRWLTHAPKSVRHSIAQFAKTHTFHGSWHLYANLAPAEEHFIGQARVFSQSEAKSILAPEFSKGPSVAQVVGRIYRRIAGKNLSEIKKKQYLDMHQWMPGDILLKADKLTMAHSLELRVPLLDRDLMSVAEKVPSRYLINDENTKYAFRQAAAKHLPQEWYDREKLGFPVPIRQWLREEEYYRYIRSVFEQDWVTEFFNQQAIIDMLDRNFAGEIDARRKIWVIYTFLTWYSIFFIGDGTKPEPVRL